MKTKLLSILGILLIVLFMSSISALRMTLTTPQVTFNENVTSLVNYHLGVENKNNYTISIQINPPTDLIINFSDPLNFTLEPNQSKNIDYTILINRTGNYYSNIGVGFYSNSENFALQSILMFNVPCIGGYVCETGTQETTENQIKENLKEDLKEDDIKTNSDIDNKTNPIESNSNSEPNFTRDPLVTITGNNETINLDNSNPSKTNYWIIGTIGLVMLVSIIGIIMIYKKKKKALLTPTPEIKIDDISN